MLNTAILMGRLTANPELRHTPQDIAVCRFTIAVDRSYAKQGEDRQTDFFDIIIWRGAAEFVCKYFRKGSMIAVQGSIQTRSYTDNQGIKRKIFEIQAEQVSFCGEKKESGLPNSAPSSFNVQTDDFEEVTEDDGVPWAT